MLSDRWGYDVSGTAPADWTWVIGTVGIACGWTWLWVMLGGRTWGGGATGMMGVTGDDVA
jgi:hypothetical protein